MNNELGTATEATEESFWSLLSKAESDFTIYIPQIQRDYAQGRTDPATTQIREKLVNDLLDSVVNYQEGKILDLNFIYGNIENQAGVKRFIPIDGQQRLTTLFLFHWYFAVLSRRIDSEEEIKETLLRFQYETRNVTGKFCENLVKDVRDDFEKIPDDKKVSDIIKNYYWFFSDFENDSSVRNMLVMIDTIHEKTRELMKTGISVDNVFNLLISEKAPIRFLYLDLKNAGLTDSIYIKMNARGKALTHFENFKAQLWAYLSKDKQFADEFIKNINGKWSEFFWQPDYRRIIRDPITKEEKHETVFDPQMMKFFRFWMFMDYIIHLDENAVRNNQRAVRDSLVKLNNEQEYIFTARLFSDGFREVYELLSESEVLGIDTFIGIERLLNILAKRQETTKSIIFTTEEEYRKVYIDEKDAFSRLIGITGGKNALSNEDQVILFAEYAFLIKYANPDYTFDKEAELSRWLRLVHNLVRPTLNLQMDIFFRMIRVVNKLIEEGTALECDKYMSHQIRRNYRQSDLFIFTEVQVVEESVKSILMGIDPAWKEAVIDSEKTFLDGQVGALLSFAGITDEYERQIKCYEEEHEDASILGNDAKILRGMTVNSSYYQSFMDYLNKFKMIFDPNGVKKDLECGELFRRALLCYGGKDSYMLPPGRNIQSFLDNTSRDYSFRRLLREDNEGKRNYLKNLLDDIGLERPIIDQLEEIIERKEFDETDRWKEFFVKMPEILECVEKNSPSKKDPEQKWVFKTPQRFIRRNGNDDILLLTRTQTNSMNRELYSYVLFLKARKKHLPVSYHENTTDGARKYASYSNRKNIKLWIDYERMDNGGYAFVIRQWIDGEGIIIKCCSKMEEVLDYIEETVIQ